MSDEAQVKGKGRPFMFFYILVIYIFSAFTWWSFLLVEKNKLSFDAIADRECVLYNVEHQLPVQSKAYFNTPHYHDLYKKYERQKWMITSEGAVFLLLLVAGTYSLYGTFKKEMRLAKQQNNFLLSITHELKSPLASIKLSLQTFSKRVALEEKFAKLLHNSLEDVDRLEGLVDNILLAAKVENSSYGYKMFPTDVSELLRNILDKLRTSFPANPIEYKIYDEATAVVDKLTFSSVIINLVENAVKYSAAGSPINVTLNVIDEEIIIEIIDQGMGISDQEKPRVFEKFYRVGAESTRSTKGTGLGLFLVKSVINDHQGKVHVFNNTPKGSIFRITLPLEVATEGE